MFPEHNRRRQQTKYPVSDNAGAGNRINSHSYPHRRSRRHNHYHHPVTGAVLN